MIEQPRCDGWNEMCAAQFDAYCDFSNAEAEPARVIAVDRGAVVVAVRVKIALLQ